MKRKILNLVLGGIFLISTGFSPDTEPRLQIKISGMENRTDTKVWVSVFSKKDFLKSPIQRKSAEVKNGTVSLAFDLPPGEYAISTYHDLNGNATLDRHFYGKPKEPYGFSNNVTPKFGPPKYDKCKFTLGEVSKVLSITLIK